MTSVVGMNPTQTIPVAALTAGAGAGLGDRNIDSDGNIWICVQASAAIAQYDVVTVGRDYSTLCASVTTTNGLRGNWVGVAPVAFASGERGWIQISGPVANINVLASCAANTRLNTTATGGSLNSDGTATTKQVQGIYLTTARAASAGPAPGILNLPFVDVTL